MRVTREELTARTERRRARATLARVSQRNTEFVLLVAGSVLVITGLYLAYSAKARRADASDSVDLNRLTGAQQLIPYLSMLPSDSDQSYVAGRIYERLRHGERFDNTGAIARMRVSEAEVPRGAAGLVDRMNQARTRREAREQEEEEERGWLASRWAHLTGRDKPRELSIRLLTPAEFAELKPHLRVRELGTFRRGVLFWSFLAIAAFFVVHLFWRIRAFAGDNLLFPAMLVLSGIGLVLMIGLRDPLRDTLLFRDFAQGVIAGCIAIALFSQLDYERSFSRLSYVPLVFALLLALALGLFGSGPGASDAKVNLLFFQPVELIRILIVLFLAGYFAQNWDALRQLRQDRTLLPEWAQRFGNLPRLDYVLPVLAGVLVSLALFFWLSDLGPALIIGCLFLTMYAIARNKALLAAAGLGLIVLGFVGGYVIGYPHTVRDRVSMWLSPWDNGARGGDQVAQSLWALSTGAGTGTGLGLGDSQVVPAAHTDLIVSALGEQLGFLGVLAVILLYAVLVYRGIRIALNAPGVYSFFLGIGLTLVTSYEILLITGGLLGLVPLSGVVSPFLSYGRTSMVANFALFGIILAVSAVPVKRDQRAHFGGASRALMAGLAILAVIVIARFGWVQVARADQTLVHSALTMQADGVRRYEYNPRLIDIARDLPKGNIFDRNGLPLAANDVSLVKQHRAQYTAIGVNIDQTTSNEGRQYPLGGPMFYLLGDSRSRLKQGATNTAFQEKASRVRLQGYDDVAELEEGRDAVTGRMVSRIRRDYSALIPLLRHRYEPDNPAVKEILERPKDVRMSIDAGLEMRASEILKTNLAKLGKTKGAIVVIDPASGDLLASVSYPWPSQDQFVTLRANPAAPLPNEDLLDRARFGLYPPGSSFKIVTAIAALRKDPALAQKRYDCIRLPDGRVGNVVWKRAIRDDVKDTQPHGSVDLQKGIVVSCNAYFAQLGADSIGAPMLLDTAMKLGISVAQPATAEKLRQFLPQASYGQGQVVVSPFQMARVAATIANGGNAPQGRWVIDETNPRVREPIALLPVALAQQLAADMRGVVTSGTGRVLSGSAIPIAGKTGTAELAKAPSHAWFIGFAPYGGKPAKQIAFAVLVENGQYGGTAAAPIAGEIVVAARKLGLI
jgi:cell division protein FtsI/penicillin-binding protein 2/cell division protein FtsW (lipid II flippase)